MTAAEALKRVEAADEKGLLSWQDDQGVAHHAAAENLTLWLTNPAFEPHLPSVLSMVAGEEWPLLVDCFKQVIPFGTAGRRGVCQPGPNRMNARTVAESAAGLADYYAAAYPDRDKVCVVARDCRLDSPEFSTICAEVLAARGFTVKMFRGDCATPMLAFTVLHQQALCGVMITASHNPPEYNGFKAYGPHGGQVVPPDDIGIIDAVNALREQPIERLPMADAEASGQVIYLDQTAISDYVNSVVVQQAGGPKRARIAYSPLQGCGSAIVLPVLSAAGFVDVQVVPEQAQPDGHFDAVPDGIANPESEPAMGAVKALGVSIGADGIIASDPDADRIGFIAPEPEGADAPWRFYNGNEIGVLVTWWAIHQRLPRLPLSPGDCWVIKSIVTSELVTRMAAAAGVQTLGDLPVGFRWIGELIEAELQDPRRLLAAIEESHGVNCGALVRDKDAASGSLALAELCAWLKAEGLTASELLDQIHAQHGYHREWMISFAPETKDEINRAVAGFRSNPPATIGPWDLSPAQVEDRQTGSYADPVTGEPVVENFLVWRVGDESAGAKVAVRPSGTEPKMKIYVQAWRAAGEDLAAARAEVDALITSIGEALHASAVNHATG